MLVMAGIKLVRVDHIMEETVLELEESEEALSCPLSDEDMSEIILKLMKH